MRTASWIAMACLAFGMVGCADESAPAPGKGPSVAATKPAAVAPAPAPAVKPAPVGTATKPAPVAPAAAGPVVLEAEKCTLKDCAAKDLSGASGGKAVLMDKDSSEAQGTVELKKGKYKVVVYMQGDEAESDAVYVTIGGGDKTRVYADPRGSVVAATLYQSDDQFFTATIDKDGPCKVLFTTAEKGAYVDRVVLTRQE